MARGHNYLSTADFKTESSKPKRLKKKEYSGDRGASKVPSATLWNKKNKYLVTIEFRETHSERKHE